MHLNAIAACLLAAAQRSLQTRILPAAAAALAVGALYTTSSAEAAGAPPIGGGYTNAIAIPVSDPAVKEIAGALFKPEGTGPFPAVVYMSGCNGLNFPPEIQQEKRVIDNNLSRGIATLIVDPFTARGEKDGACDKLDVPGFTRGGNDAVAAVKVLKSMPDINPAKIFLQGYSYGAIASLYATDTNTPGDHDTTIAGLITYYPYCYDNVSPSVPTLVLIGEKDDWTPAAACQAVKGKVNFDLIVYPGATHGFTEPFEKPFDVDGHHLAHDEAATKDAEQRVEAFVDSRLKK
jgi:dienelactone hydrolase